MLFELLVFALMMLVNWIFDLKKKILKPKADNLTDKMKILN